MVSNSPASCHSNEKTNLVERMRIGCLIKICELLIRSFRGQCAPKFFAKEEEL